MFKFGDIVENGYASANNPQRVGVVVRVRSRGIDMTDTKGKFWASAVNNERLKKIGSVLKEGKYDGLSVAIPSK